MSITPFTNMPDGRPLRRTSEKLGVFIQTSILDEGHDSGADAKAALDLVKWKVMEDDKRATVVE